MTDEQIKAALLETSKPGLVVFMDSIGVAWTFYRKKEKNDWGHGEFSSIDGGAWGEDHDASEVVEWLADRTIVSADHPDAEGIALEHIKVNDLYSYAIGDIDKATVIERQAGGSMKKEAEEEEKVEEADWSTEVGEHHQSGWPAPFDHADEQSVYRSDKGHYFTKTGTHTVMVYWLAANTGDLMQAASPAEIAAEAPFTLLGHALTNVERKKLIAKSQGETAPAVIPPAYQVGAMASELNKLPPRTVIVVKVPGNVIAFHRRALPDKQTRWYSSMSSFDSYGPKTFSSTYFQNNAHQIYLIYNLGERSEEQFFKIAEHATEWLAGTWTESGASPASTKSEGKAPKIGEAVESAKPLSAKAAGLVWPLLWEPPSTLPPADKASPYKGLQWADTGHNRYLVGLAPAQAKAAVYAASVYAALGAKVAPHFLVQDKLVIELPEGWTPAPNVEAIAPFIADLSAEFPADALLANWTVAGNKQGVYSNLATSGPTYERVTCQGALTYRFGGDTKTLSATEVPEITSLLDASTNPTAAQIFSGAKDGDHLSSDTFDMINRIVMLKNTTLLDELDQQLGVKFAAILKGRAAVLEGLLTTNLSHHFAADAPMIEKKKAKKTQGPILAAGALITDGKRVLLARRADSMSSEPGAWSIPGGSIDPGESAVDAALREAHEELGHLPKHLQYTGVTITATFPEKQTTFHTVVFSVAPKHLNDLKEFRPFLGDKAGSHTWETEGWAWVRLDELALEGGAVVWRPKLHPGLGMPTEFESNESVGLKSIFQVWMEHGGSWADILAKKGSFDAHGIDLEAIIEQVYKEGPKGLPFAGNLMANPRRPNPEGYVLSGLRQDREGHEFIEYRPRMPDGSRPRIRLQLKSVPVGVAQAGQEMREIVKAQRAGVAIPSTSLSAGSSFVVSGQMRRKSKGQPIWPAHALHNFIPVVAAVLGKAHPTYDDLQKAWLLEELGYPLSEATPLAAEATQAAEVKLEEVSLKGELPTAPAALAKILPIGKAQLTKVQIKTIDSMYDAMLALLGEESHTSSGKGAKDPALAKHLKSKIQSALQMAYSGEGENIALWLRWIAQARSVGLWRERIDPGARVVYRGLPDIHSITTGSFTWDADRSTAQFQAMLQSGVPGIAQAGSNPNAIKAALAWINWQAQGKGWVRGRRGIYEPSTELKPPSFATSLPSQQLDPWKGEVTPPPKWADQPWANVDGFALLFQQWKYKEHGEPQPVAHWSAEEIGSFGQNVFLMRSTTDQSPGFIMRPAYTLDGENNFQTEREVLHVDLNDKMPVPIQIVRFNIEGSAELTTSQKIAYERARPPFPPEYMEGKKS